MFMRVLLLLTGLLLLIAAPTVRGQSSENWQIPEIRCDAENCIWLERADDAGNLYVYTAYYQGSWQETVYVVQRNSNQAVEYKLSDFYPRRGPTRDFVPFSNGEVVIVDYQVPNPVAVVNLQTQQVTSVNFDFPVVQCVNRIAEGLGPNVQRVGQNKVLFCSYGDDGRHLVLVRYENNTFHVENTVSMGFPNSTESGSGPMWRTLVGGLDGRIYVVSLPGTPVMNQLAPDYASSDMSDYVVLRYDPATQQWDTVFIEASDERWRQSEVAGTLIYMSVDTAGNLYFANSGGTKLQPITDFVKYDAQGHKVWHLTEADFDGRAFRPLLIDEDRFIFNFGDGKLQYVNLKDGIVH